jgi:hypothetical protein
MLISNISVEDTLRIPHLFALRHLSSRYRATADIHNCQSSGGPWSRFDHIRIKWMQSVNRVKLRLAIPPDW